MDSRTQFSSGGMTMAAQAQPRRSGGCFPLALVAFVLGIIVGVAAVFSYILIAGNDNSPRSAPPYTGKGAIMAQISTGYISQLVTQNANSAGLPGTIKDTQVQLVQNGPITITGQDQVNVLGINVTKQFTLRLQPTVEACQLRMHLIHADIGGFPITGMTTQFEDQLNQQFQIKVSNLPSGFTYCMTETRTNSDGLTLVYAATPAQSSALGPEDRKALAS
ncbi:hypothetical protein EPA93_18925 [Ktedonosporobacter rubrisoli]|uniref:Uncharacterized protein n=1 Tax=Ktedonosporobacter rubrisoli TaxID=2509675 RepID=A0A4P6JSV0_KTERU|nr:hypothetical protein [Ktedonosporobacter rubrisoli]QBD77956.1 hypothetical protein EPA93_18925 [Ktedonosporobacter rubrisoli]